MGEGGGKEVCPEAAFDSLWWLCLPTELPTESWNEVHRLSTSWGRGEGYALTGETTTKQQEQQLQKLIAGEKVHQDALQWEASECAKSWGEAGFLGRSWNPGNAT